MPVALAADALGVVGVVLDCGFVQGLLQAAIGFSAGRYRVREAHLRTKSCNSAGLTGLRTNSAALLSRPLLLRMNVKRLSSVGSSAMYQSRDQRNQSITHQASSCSPKAPR